MANVQADWAEADNTKDSYIANKPDLSVYALKTDLTSLGNVQPDWNQDDAEAADFIKNKPAIPSTVVELSDAEDYAKKTDLVELENVQADWNQADEEATDYIKNKPTNVSVFANDAEYITKAEFDEWKASNERRMLGMLAEAALGGTYKGAFMSAFSVSSTKKVVFSQGNLQYKPSTGTWRFAAHQYDVVGGTDKNGATGGNVYEGGVKCSNQNANNPSYTGWIDLFCYGTSGWNSGASLYHPTDYSEISNNFINENLTGDYANADWGVYNAISNGGNRAGMWRTLTGAEWHYLVLERDNASSLVSLGKIMINETAEGVTSIEGIILLPDEWVLPDGCSFHSTGLSVQSSNKFLSTDGFSTNVYTLDQWSDMQKAGAIFLPASGITYKYEEPKNSSTYVFGMKNMGKGYGKTYVAYWSSTVGSWFAANEDGSKTGTAGSYVYAEHYVQLQQSGMPVNQGLCVRLVRDIE